MAPRPISPRLHGILDYATGAEMLLLPTLLGTGGSRSGRFLRVAGLAHIAGAALTDTEVGVAKVLPFKTHLKIDMVHAPLLATTPWLLRTSGEGVRHWLPQLLFAANDALVTALTQGSEVAVQETAATVADAAPTSGSAGADGEVKLSPPDPNAAVMPDGAEANDGIGARTIGDL